MVHIVLNPSKNDVYICVEVSFYVYRACAMLKIQFKYPMLELIRLVVSNVQKIWQMFIREYFFLQYYLQHFNHQHFKELTSAL